MQGTETDSISTLIELLRLQKLLRGEEVAFRFLHFDGCDDETISYLELDRRARTIGYWLQKHLLPGQRALLLYPPGLDYISGLFGCMYAGVIAVPAYPPNLNRPARTMPRLKAIVQDAQVDFALTNRKTEKELRLRTADYPEIYSLELMATDSLDIAMSDSWQHPDTGGQDLALLQYTSGSTARPKGVMISHANILHNQQMLVRCSYTEGNRPFVNWLPPYHDMGLVGGILHTCYVGTTCHLMSPEAFLRKPIRWLRLISDTRAAYTTAPNFAFHLAVQRTTEDQRRALDLSSLRVCYNGAEPISAVVLDEFVKTYAPYGFKPEAIYPCYGMAESTLIISGGKVGSFPQVQAFDAADLERGIATASDPDADRIRLLVGCGHPILDEKIRIVDPNSCTECSPGRVGEIWVSSRSVGSGYWQRTKDTHKVFEAILHPSGEGPFLRTGDLGFFFLNELFVTGRIKEVIILHGLNHYPQDIESTVQKSHPAICRSGGAAFGIEKNGQEHLVMVQEIDRRQSPDLEPLLQSALESIRREHSLIPYAFIMIRRGTLPRTSSGKIQRNATKKAFLTGTLPAIKEWYSEHFASIESGQHQLVPPKSSKPVGTVETFQEIALWLQEKIASIADLPVDQISIDQPFALYGLDSITAVQLSDELETKLGCRVDPEIFYNYPSIDAASSYLASLSSQKNVTPEPSALKRVASAIPTSSYCIPSIAIVGMSCRFPKAENTEAFWDLLLNGVDVIREVPRNRWNLEEFYDPNPKQIAKISSRFGGFLDQIDEFDADFFGISAREAEKMDPQQRLLLEVVWEALERSAIPPGSLSGISCGVFIGVSSSDYSQLLSKDHSQVDGFYGTGNAHSIVANRLSYLLDLRGPSMAIDTACSSSLTAIHTAVQSLNSGECDLAIVGGVNVIISPSTSIGFSHLGTLTPNGHCQAFDAKAKGYSRSEGVGALVIKPLLQAQKDRDTILAMIKGSAVMHGGRSNGLTAPCGPAQKRVIWRALESAGVSPSELGYVEAHGSGTLVADAIELNSLGDVLKKGGHSMVRPCLVGSVKTNLGSMEAASGMAAVIKTVLTLQKKKVPAHLHLEEINPNVAIDNLPIRIPTSVTPWQTSDRPRLAGVSSFAFGGVNAHLILQESPEPVGGRKKSKRFEQIQERPYHILCLSAKNEPALRQLASAMSQVANKYPLSDVCFTANTGRDHFNYRLAVVADSHRNMQNCLFDFIKIDKKRIRPVTQGQHCPGFGLIWLFGDVENLPLELGRGLSKCSPRFREILHKCEPVVKDCSGDSLLDTLDRTKNGSTSLSSPMDSFFAFALGDALAELWLSWGLIPKAVMGQGIGELVAAHRASALTREKALQLIWQWSRTDNEDSPELNRFYQSLETHPLELPFISTIDGIAYKKGEKLPRDYFRKHRVKSPNLEKSYLALQNELPCFMQQTWPCKFTLDFLSQYSLHHLVTALVPNLSEWESLLLSIAHLYVHGFNLNWREFDLPFRRKKVLLPTYPFQRRRYWIPPTKESSRGKPHLPSFGSSHPFIHRRNKSPQPAHPIAGMSPKEIAKSEEEAS